MTEAPPDYTVTLQSMSYGGDAIGRLPDGRAVFVPLALSGERVRLRIIEEKRGFVRGELIEIIEPSPDRIVPKCIHFGLCGGCHYQHIPYALQLKIKENILREQFQRIGGIAEPPVRPVVPSPTEWNYRNHVQFHLSPQGKLGYYTLRADKVFAIQECHLPEAALNELWPQLDFEAITGLDRIGLRIGADEDAMIVLEGDDLSLPEVTVEQSVSVVHVGQAGQVVLAGDEAVVMEVSGRPFRVSAGSFFQVNIGQAAAMVEHLMQRLPLTPNTLAMDLYCGVGLFSAFIAPKVGRLVAIEVSETACGDFTTNLNEFENVELYKGTAEDVLPGLDLQPDFILVDPPRSGLERRALNALIKIHPALLAYVSCDAATLARDAKRLLADGYQLVESTPFDLFPQTYHIESINIFRSNP